MKCALECFLDLLTRTGGQRRRLGDLPGSSDPQRDDPGEQEVELRMPKARFERRLHGTEHGFRRRMTESIP